MLANKVHTFENSRSSWRDESGKHDPSIYTIAWICALSTELTAAKAMLDQVHHEETYITGSVHEHNVVLACLPMGKMGNSAAAATMAELLHKFPGIKSGFMVGIGGGVPRSVPGGKEDVRLGDVVVGTPGDGHPGVVQWDMGKKIVRGGGEQQVLRTGALDNPPRDVLTALSVLKSRHDTHGPCTMLDHLRGGVATRMTTDKQLCDIVFPPDSLHRDMPSADSVCDASSSVVTNQECKFCDASNAQLRKDGRGLKIHYGLIASGNMVIKDARERDRISDELTRCVGGAVLCFEMEAAGLLSMFPCLIVRGICDYADTHKNKTWQPYAAMVAAAYARELLTVLLPASVQSMTNALGKYTPFITFVFYQLTIYLNIVYDQIDKLYSFLERDHHRKALSRVQNWLGLMSYDEQQHIHFHTHHLQQNNPLLTSRAFENFLHSSGKETMFCHGAPGVGKTLLTSMVVNKIQSHLDVASSQTAEAPSKRQGLAFIYCSYDEKHSLIAILANIIKQLLSGVPTMPQSIESLYTKYQNIHISSLNRKIAGQFTEALSRLISGFYGKVYIVIDALNENDNAASLLDELFQIQQTTDTNMFATARYGFDRKWFSDDCISEVRGHDEDVLNYIQNRMEEMDVLRAGQDEHMLEDDEKSIGQIREKVKEQVAAFSEGKFLVARLYMDLLDAKTSADEVMMAVKAPPSGQDAYNETYDKTFLCIHNQREERRSLAKCVFDWVLYAHQPLTMRQLQYALAMDPDREFPSTSRLVRPEIIKAACHGLLLLEGTSGKVRLLHQTTYEYLVRHMRHLSQPLQTGAIAAAAATPSPPLAMNEGEYVIGCHLTMARACAACLAFATPPPSQRGPFHDYAARWWAHHANEALAGDNLDNDPTTRRILSSFAVRRNEIFRLFLQNVCRGTDTRPFYAATSGLHIAAYHGLERLVRFFADANPDLDGKNIVMRTPLSFAVEGGHHEIASLLLQRGADPGALSDGLFLQQALTEKTKRYSGIEPLTGLFTPLHLAAANNDERMTRLLLRYGADPAARNAFNASGSLWARMRWMEPARYTTDRGVLDLLWGKG